MIEFLAKNTQWLKSAITTTGDKAEEIARWWAIFRAKNPNADKAVLKVGETLEDIQRRLGDISDNVSGAKSLEQASALIEQQKKYNDVLATRVAEALDEIKALKARVASLEDRR